MNDRVIQEVTRCIKRTHCCPRFIRRRYDVSSWLTTSSVSESSSSTRNTVSSKISVPASSGLGALDDSYFQVTAAVTEKKVSTVTKIKDMAKKKTMRKKEPDWVKNEESLAEQINSISAGYHPEPYPRQLGQRGVDNPAFYDESSTSTRHNVTLGFDEIDLEQEQSQL